jgi:hypothetical protein
MIQPDAEVLCGCCNKPAVAMRGEDRFGTYRDLSVPIPDDLVSYHCAATGKLCADPDLMVALRRGYREGLRRSCGDSIAKLAGACSGRRLEALLGLSQGYLSRLKSGKGQPSRCLSVLLALLARYPDLLREVEGGRL